MLNFISSKATAFLSRIKVAPAKKVARPSIDKASFINHELGLSMPKAKAEAEKVSVFLPKGKGDTLFVKRLSSGRFIAYNIKKQIRVFNTLQDVWSALEADYSFCSGAFPCN